VASTFVEGVTDHATLWWARRNVEHELVAAPSQFVMEILVAHTGLDYREGQLLVDLKDAVHPVAEINHDLTLARRRTRPEADILSGRHWIERCFGLIGDAHERLHLTCRCRIDDAGRTLVTAGQGVLAIAADGFLRAIDAAVAKYPLNLRKE